MRLDSMTNIVNSSSYEEASVIVAGINIGSEMAKAVLLQDDIIASSVILREEEARYVAERVLRVATK